MKLTPHELPDVDILLDKKEFEKLINKKTKDFFDSNAVNRHLLEAKAYVFLGHCKKNYKFLKENAYELNKGVQIVIPDEDTKPYFINLPPGSKAIEELKNKRIYSARYPWGPKITIRVKNLSMEVLK